MPLKTYRPTTPGLRGAAHPSFEEITRSRPEKSLVTPLKRSGGRDSSGKISVRHRGGGAKRAYRIIDFKRDKVGVPGKVASIEYDPNRSVRISLVHYPDGDKRYILCPHGLKVGDRVEAGPDDEVDDEAEVALRGMLVEPFGAQGELEVVRPKQIGIAPPMMRDETLALREDDEIRQELETAIAR